MNPPPIHPACPDMTGTTIAAETFDELDAS